MATKEKTQSIESQAVITGIRAKVDGSLGLSLNTPELSPDEKVLFMNLQNLNVRMTIEPMDIKPESKAKIEKAMDGKSPSERLYNVIFVYYKQVKSTDPFETFYAKHIERIIDTYKAKLI
ncbi:MAG: hypothetical protein NTZ84_02920 [Candidatus Nealsonbacteria bacterium]|nr:hypothetical protein [Candidatus Nealsonbacteria bacterium]